jgi:hypothetical protein
MTLRRHIGVRLLTLAATMAASAAFGQPVGRRATTLTAIKAFPGFFNGQTVLVRAEVKQDQQRASVVSGDETVPALIRPGVTVPNGVAEVRGEVWDIGRMQPDDARFTGRDLRVVLGVDPGSNWPRPGEVLVLNVTSADAADPLAAPSLRNIALTPERYAEQHVTIKGQFRGRNLFGDQPQAPPGGDGKREFVLRSAEASLWITGKQPKGRGFTFDIMSRLDSRRWLEVSGTVRTERGLTWIVAEELAETTPQIDARPEQFSTAPTIIPPEVLFSAPTADETDVKLDTKVRIQFSRDLDPDTLKGRVRVSYAAPQSAERGEPQAPTVNVHLNYNRGTRVLELSFDQPLDRFRVVTISLEEGILGTDGGPLKPWKVTFTLGGS